MLATLFDFPFEDRRKLTYWSDIAVAEPDSALFRTDDYETEFAGIMTECLDYFTRLWNERINAEPRGDRISMMAHGEATRDMGPMEYLGNLILLIVGGNDTTRNTMSGSVFAMDRNPGERAKLYGDPSLVPSMVSETIRWQTPLAYMRRTATRDVELAGKIIPKGDKVAILVRLGKSRPRRHRRSRQLHHRPPQPPSPSLLRFRDSSLRRQPPGRIAAEGPVGRGHETLPRDPRRGPVERVPSAFIEAILR